MSKTQESVAPAKKPFSRDEKRWMALYVLVAVLLVVTVVKGLVSDDGNPGVDARQSCETAWSNSSLRELGGNKDTYIDECMDGMRELDDAIGND